MARIRVYFKLGLKNTLKGKILDMHFNVYPVEGDHPGRNLHSEYDCNAAHMNFLNELSSSLRLKLVIFIPNGSSKLDVVIR